MIVDLTKEQEASLRLFGARIFDLATSTGPANHDRAEKAARRMAEIAGVQVDEVIWVASPERGAAAYDDAWGQAWAGLKTKLDERLEQVFRSVIRARLVDSLGQSGSIDHYVLGAALMQSLAPCVSFNLKSNVRDSTRHCVWDGLWDSFWLGLWAFPMLHMGIEYEPEFVEKLKLFLEIAESCFALWIVPGKIILCERPDLVEFADEKLSAIAWRVQ